MALSHRRLAQLKQSISEVDPQQAHQMQRDGAVLIDVREAEEISQGTAHGALPLGRGYLELRIEQAVPDHDTPVLLMCAGGVRSLFAADDLTRMGYTNVHSVAGGFKGWAMTGLPLADARDGLSNEDKERYSRHLRIPEIGEEGQQKLLDSRVLVIGAGGLGCPSAFYLAAAGVGTLGIIDDDRVDRSNLQRQILHTDDRVGAPKVASAIERLRALNPSIELLGADQRLTADNAEAILRDFEVVVDGSDNFETRYLVNDVCVKLGLPNVHGSVYRFEGQASVFWTGRPGDPGPCYRCLFAEPPSKEAAPSCDEAGVLGVVPGLIGMIQATEAIKLLLGIGDSLVGRVLRFDALTMRLQELKLARDPSCATCGR